MTSKTIGLTGGIGSGKTFVSDIFKRMDVPVYNSDSNAKRLMVENVEVINKVKTLLGEKAYDSKGGLNKEYIADIIFKKPEIREQLNEIVHPAVRKDFLKFLKANADSKLVINEAALFVENGSYKDFNFLISVVAPEKLRIERVATRDSRIKEEIMDRIQAQNSDHDKITVSNFIIYNDASDNLFRQISEIHAELITFVKKEIL